MIVREFASVTYVLLDFEGLGSFERSAQEDMLLSVRVLVFACLCNALLCGLPQARRNHQKSVISKWSSHLPLQSLQMMLGLCGWGCIDSAPDSQLFSILGPGPFEVFNAAISHVSLFRTENRLDCDTANIFSRMQQGAKLIQGDDELFNGAFQIVVKDVVSDAKEVAEEFRQKIQHIIARDKEDNFFLRLYKGRVPPLARHGFKQRHSHTDTLFFRHRQNLLELSKPE